MWILYMNFWIHRKPIFFLHFCCIYGSLKTLDWNEREFPGNEKLRWLWLELYIYRNGFKSINCPYCCGIIVHLLKGRNMFCIVVVHAIISTFIYPKFLSCVLWMCVRCYFFASDLQFSFKNMLVVCSAICCEAFHKWQLNCWNQALV